MTHSHHFDVVILGGGAAGLMCAIEAGRRGRHVCVIDHGSDLGEKIRISGGGRCNFTNLGAVHSRYLSQNPHFCKSALAQYKPQDFVQKVSSHGIAYHEKKLGQLFCDGSAKQIVEMLRTECLEAGVVFYLETTASEIDAVADGFELKTSVGEMKGQSLVVACGGLSIPKMGASNLGYRLAQKFGHDIVPTRPGLVPLTFGAHLLDKTKEMSGLSVDDVMVSSQNGASFREALLMTHRGLSGPAILQISSYWQPGEPLEINLLPSHNVLQLLKEARKSAPKQQVDKTLSGILPKKLADYLSGELGFAQARLADLSDAKLGLISDQLCKWRVMPVGSEGYRTAEVTVGGVDTTGLSSKTMESKLVKGLFFIGEVVDVTGWLGGYNFQWAWSSGWCAGQVA